MDQLKSNDPKETKIPLPRRTFTVEFFVGIFTLLGVLCIGYLAIGLGGVELLESDKYDMYAEFDNISGLKYGASVEVAGVPIGVVSNIALKDPMALVTLKINKGFEVKSDDIASIRTKGIIGDRYVKISRGGSKVYLKPGDRISDTESVVDIEDIIGKIVHSFSSDKKDS